MTNDNILETVRKKYHKFWYNIKKELNLPDSIIRVLRHCVELQSRKFYDADINELLEKGEIN